MRNDRDWFTTPRTKLKILMATNTYLSIVGGLEKSIQSFSQKFREMGHEVLIAGPDFVGLELGKPKEEKKKKRRSKKVIAQPELQNKDTVTPLAWPFKRKLIKIIDKFKPDVVHAHHPFLMGEMALRFAARYDRPIVYTYHILFDQYAHYLNIATGFSSRFLVELAAGYANNVTRVIAPSESVEKCLRDEGVHKPIDVVPTGVDVKVFSKGDRQHARQNLGLKDGDILFGYIGRLAVEKNMEFLARMVSKFLLENENVHFMLAGKGPYSQRLQRLFSKAQVSNRVHMTGPLQGQDLVDHYHALDLFTFTSKSETQGMVLTEAMAAGVPVIGIKAPGVREVIKDGENGRLVSEESFFDGLKWCAEKIKDKEAWEKMRQNARETADAFSLDICAQRALMTYHAAIADYAAAHQKNGCIRSIKTELDILYNLSRAGVLAVAGKTVPECKAA